MHEMASPRKFSPRPRTAARLHATHGAVIGLEAEFSLFVNEQRRKPEEVFGTPAALLGRHRTIPRSGRSVHMASGGALYFDTGVVEVATPVIELERGCGERATRCLWEQIAFVREELDAWEKARRETMRLEGFSAHYNVAIPAERQLEPAGLHQLALLLTYLLPAPIMLLAANRMSTGVGVRPREDRIEVTVDFTPDEELMTATAAFIAAVVPAVAMWPEHGIQELAQRGFPRIVGFLPRKHTSRKGFLARFDCFPKNPFVTDPNKPEWPLENGRMASLRQVALGVARPFRDRLRAVASRETVHHVRAVIAGRARSLLDFPQQPSEYRDVRPRETGRRLAQNVDRSRYERIIHRLLKHHPIRVASFTYRPERMVGWFEVVMRNLSTGTRRTFSLEELARHAGI
ncbi:MAG: hypothetical protein ABIO94_09635 [Opitutaceae bacterium]